MKWISDWWGIQLIAETDEDEAQLRALFAALPKRAAEEYEEGELYEAEHYTAVLLYDEIPARYVLRFRR